MKKEFGDYYIGLDVGTNSVGWAVTNENYELLKFNGKSMWGSRLFSEGKTAAERRTFRTNRRRLSRREQRIKLLKSLFNEEITKIDPEFFLRLDYSKYQYKLGHKDNLPTDDTLFADENFKDKDYHKKYPTIYHLRNELVHENNIEDPRLLYLACEHIIKHRGHFLIDGDIKSVNDFESIFNIYKEIVLDICPDWDLSMVASNTVQEILKTEKGITNKKNKLKNIFNCVDKKQEEIINLLAGGKSKLKTIFELDEDFNYSLKDDYDESLEKFESIGENCLEFIDASKAIYDWALLANIINDKTYLCEGKVEAYNKHKNDLKKLKEFVKQYCSKDIYNEIFNENKKGLNNYVAYSFNSIKNKKKIGIEAGKCSQEEFCEFLRKQFKEIKLEDVNENGKYILNQISADNNSLCPKQKDKNNSIIPYQVNCIELEAILENASHNFKWINNEDKDGKTIKEKIIKLLTFKIPYYVGPINVTQKDNVINWMETTNSEKVKITPWNFDEKVDVEKSAENFIRRMTNKCQYLIQEDVIPKESILYSKYKVLNELNNLTVCGERLDIETKQAIFNDLYLVKKKVNKKEIVKYLKYTGKGTFDINDIGGIASDIESSMKSYVDFRNILNEKFDEKYVELAITAITLFHDDKKLLRKRLESIGNGFFDADEVKKISNLKYDGWASFSRKLLVGITNENPLTGEVVDANYNIIDALYNTKCNFMELLSGNYNYYQNIENENKQYSDDVVFSYEGLIEDLYCSPAVKKAIWQTLLIVKEIIKICGHQPKKIFMEMAKGEDEKRKEDGRTFSRKANLEELYSKCKKEETELFNSLKNTDNLQLRKDALYLYYIQRGKCMYSGEPIEIEDLYNDNLYDIDHIYPQSKCKDDSIENRVLVKKELNSEKSDEYPIRAEWKIKMLPFWTDLHSKGFIGDEKYRRLTRNTPFTEDELAGFIARQLVETRQSTKILAKLLAKLYTKSRVVYVKAKNVSDFKNNFDLVKVRELNDLHHAKDAYCNVVVGNVWDEKFTSNPLMYIKNSQYRSYNLAKMFDNDIVIKNKEIWKSGKEGTEIIVKKMYYRNDALLTMKSFENHGALFDLQLVKKGKGQHKIKNNDTKMDTTNYGGYNKVSTAYFAACKDCSNSLSIEPVFIEQAKEVKQRKLLTRDNKSYKVLAILPMNTIMKIDGFECYISGRTNDNLVLNNFMPIVFNYSNQKYIKELFKYKEFKNNNKEKVVSAVDYSKNHDVKLNKLDNLGVYDEIIRKYSVKYKTFYGELENKLNREKFIKLSLEEQCDIISDLLQVFKSKKTDLSIIDGNKTAGLLYINKKLSNFEKVRIINKSITGLFEKETILK